MSFTPHGIIEGRGRPRRRRAEHRVVCHERQPADLAEDAGQSREGDAGARLRARRARPGHDQQPLAHHRSAHRNHGDHARRGAVPILRAIRATAKEHGYDLILMSSTCTTEDLADMRRLGKGNLVDAFIMLDIRHHDGRLKSAMKLGLPIVAVRRPRVSVHQHLRPGERHMRRTAWDTAGAVRGEGHALAIVRAADREVPGVEGQRRMHLHPLAADACVDRADDAAHRRHPRQGHRADRRGRSKSPSSRSKARNSSPA